MRFVMSEKSSTDHATRSAANTIGTWRVRQKVKGRTLTDAELRDQVRTRWPQLSEEQVAAIVAVCQQSPLPQESDGNRSR